MEEQHYTVKEIAEQWGLGTSTVRRLFIDEPGVLCLPHVGRRTKRDYVSLRIPASVADRVRKRLARPALELR